MKALARMLSRERDAFGRKRIGPSFPTYTGQVFFPFDPLPEEVHFDDVCVGLARQPRYNGQSREFLSVAEHSVLVSLYVEEFARVRDWAEFEVINAARQALLHDGAEAYIGDMVRSLKHHAWFRPFRRLEAPVQRMIYQRFEVAPTKWSTALVNEVDNRIFVDEVQAVMLDPHMYLENAPPLDELGADVAGLDWDDAADVWAQRFQQLYPGFVTGSPGFS